MAANNLKPKIGNHIRPEFRRLLKSFRRGRELANLLGTTDQNICMMKKRGYMSKKMAYKAEVLTGYKYKARLLRRAKK